MWHVKNESYSKMACKINDLDKRNRLKIKGIM